VHPRLFQFGHFVLPAYGVLLALGVIAALVMSVYLARLLSIDTGQIWNLSLLGIATAIVSAKLLLAAARWRQYGARSFAFGLSGAQWPVLGGIALAIATCFLYARLIHLPIRRSADAFAPALALGSSIASIACLEAGCDHGTPTHLPWAIVFTSPYCPPGTPLGVPLHPTQIYSSAADFVLFVLLLWLLDRPHRDGEIMGAWLYLSGLSGFFLMFFRGEPAGSRLFGGSITVTQLIAVAMVVLGGSLWLRRAPVHPPVVQPRISEGHHAH
jgi:phosphatidylglycerol---prolipoprotein diacylglyceryl transferase